jgi:hypothetical protein
MWKVAKGVVLRKANKSDYNNPKAYRIICLLNCMGKIVEMWPPYYRKPSTTNYTKANSGVEKDTQ